MLFLNNRKIKKMKKLKSAVLFSGGKDSCLALYYAMKQSNVQCLITIISENKASYMFHTINVTLAKQQAKAMGLPIIIKKTAGQKEEELSDLERAIKEAKKKFKIEAIFTGAVASNYQKSRIEKICKKLNLKCFNPLWNRDQFELLREIISLKFNVMVTGTFALGMENFVGRKIDEKFISDMKKIYQKYRVSPAGEGGEFETFVLDAPFFKKKIGIVKSHVEKENDAEVLIIEKTRFEKKK